MRFYKGSKVEVLSKKEFPTGAWRCAEIVSGNGHTYNVKIDCFPVTGEAKTEALERVPRKAIRPCPPPVNCADDWVSGDVVEFFDEVCWKPAVIVRVFGGNNFSVRVLGSNCEFIAHKFSLRFRQSWEDGNWFLIGKDLKSAGLSRGKRSLDLSDAGGRKRRVIEKGNIGGKRIVVRLPSPIIPMKSTLVERCIADDTVSCASSVGSCSAAHGGEDFLDYANDADSFREEENSVYTSAESGTDIHVTELCTYQKALRILHGSGRLTPDKKRKVTNLRRSLNISMDEHLRELRKLIPNGNGHFVSCF